MMDVLSLYSSQPQTLPKATKEYEWKESPNTTYPDEIYAYPLQYRIKSGLVKIMVVESSKNGQYITKETVLRAGDSVYIPANTIFSAFFGSKGCRFTVTEYSL